MKSQPHGPGNPILAQSSGAPFYLACAIMFICSAMVVMVTQTSTVGVVAFLAGISLAMLFLVLPSWLEHRAESLEQLSIALAELEKRTYDLESVRREHRRALVRSEEIQEKAEELAGGLKEQTSRLSELFALKEELIQARQDRQRAHSLMEARDRTFMDYYDSLERLLTQDGLSSEYREGTKRALEQLHRTLSSTGLDPIHPAPGDPLDDRMHQVQSTQEPRNGIPEHHVVLCTHAGFRRGDTILRRAEVCLATAKSQTEDPA